MTTTAGDEITADIWFRAHGVRINSDYLAGGELTTRTPQGHVPVTDTLNVRGYQHVYAIGDITDVDEAKMAGYAMQHAEVVAQNILAQLRGEQPAAAYRPLPHPMILLPLGPRGGVGQLPTPDGRPSSRPRRSRPTRGRPVHRPLRRAVRPGLRRTASGRAAAAPPSPARPPRRVPLGPRAVSRPVPGAAPSTRRKHTPDEHLLREAEQCPHMTSSSGSAPIPTSTTSPSCCV
nr:hypothetical protein GCM10020093_069150 [Planobispora longispora]